MKLAFYNAGCGDASSISFVGNSGKTVNVFIDGGYARTYRDILAGVLKELERRKLSIDLWVVTHIHDDHIGGVINYVNAVLEGRTNDIVKCWWYNPPRQTSSILPVASWSKAQSIKQAVLLTNYLEAKNVLPGQSVLRSTEARELDGMKIYVLSPSHNGLEKLAEKYRDPKIELEKIEDATISRGVSSRQRDFHLKAEDIDLSSWEEDTNIDNGSSIALLTEFQGKKVLWLADSHPSIIRDSLLALGFSEQLPLSCDYVKVSHHGSPGNASDELYRLINCQNYILPVDGYNNKGLPAKACIIRILTSSNRSNGKKYTFYFTSDDPILRNIFEVDDEGIFKRLNFEIVFPKNGSPLEFDLDS